MRVLGEGRTKVFICQAEALGVAALPISAALLESFWHPKCSDTLGSTHIYISRLINLAGCAACIVISHLWLET